MVFLFFEWSRQLKNSFLQNTTQMGCLGMFLKQYKGISVFRFLLWNLQAINYLSFSCRQRIVFR
jgi:hypothetical protein